MKGFVYLIWLMMLLGCATQKQPEKRGVYDILYRERLAEDYEAVLLKHKESLRLTVTYGDAPIAEMEVDGENIKMVRSRGREGRDLRVLTVDGNPEGWRIFTMNSSEDDITMISDLTGDGFPEMMAITERKSWDRRNISLKVVEEGQSVGSCGNIEDIDQD